MKLNALRFRSPATRINKDVQFPWCGSGFEEIQTRNSKSTTVKSAKEFFPGKNSGEKSSYRLSLFRYRVPNPGLAYKKDKPVSRIGNPTARRVIASSVARLDLPRPRGI
jgi:hypothetical protein